MTLRTRQNLKFKTLVKSQNLVISKLRYIIWSFVVVIIECIIDNLGNMLEYYKQNKTNLIWNIKRKLSVGIYKMGLRISARN